MPWHGESARARGPAPRTPPPPRSACAKMSRGWSGMISRSRPSAPGRPRSSAAHSISSSRDSGNSRPLGTAARWCPERPTRCSRVAIERVEPIWHTRSNRADVDPQLERCGRDQRLKLPLFQPVSASRRFFSREAAVMRRHLIRAQPLGEMQRERSASDECSRITSVVRCSRISCTSRS